VRSLRRAYDERSSTWVLVWIKQMPECDPLRSHPDFVALMQQIGLNESGPEASGR